MGEKELVRIAVELGLEEQYVRKALADNSTFAPEDKGKITSWDRTLERTAPGLPNSEAFEVALDEFGPSMGVQSGPNTVGDTMTYQSMVGLSHCEMLVSKKAGRTRVKVGVSTFLPIIMGIPIIMAAGIIGGVFGESVGPVVGWSIGIGGVVANWLATRSIIKWSNKKVVKKLEALIERINREAQRVPQSGTGDGG